MIATLAAALVMCAVLVMCAARLAMFFLRFALALIVLLPLTLAFGTVVMALYR